MEKEKNKDQLQEGQVVLCVVEKIIGTTVFVNIQNNGEGTIITSEISPGRIRNLRNYVIPGKRIVCKILQIRDNRIHLSLRRVKQFEKKELLDKISKEKNFKGILKGILGEEKSQNLIEKITEQETILEFAEKLKENKELLKKYLSTGDAEKIIKTLESKKEKLKELKQIFTFYNRSSNGIFIIKKIIGEIVQKFNCEISYIAAGKYKVSLKGKKFKELKIKANKIFEEIKNNSKKEKCEFSIEKS